MSNPEQKTILSLELPTPSDDDMDNDNEENEEPEVSDLRKMVNYMKQQMKRAMELSNAMELSITSTTTLPSKKRICLQDRTWQQPSDDRNTVQEENNKKEHYE